MVLRTTERGNRASMVSFDTVRGQADALDSAKAIPLLFEPGWGQAEIDWDREEEFHVPAGSSLKQSKNFHGILNVEMGEIAATVSKRYEPLQHKTMVHSILNAVERAGLADQGIYRIENDRNVARLEMLMPSMTLRDDVSAEGLNVGFRFVNSYNTSNSFRADLFLWRLVCSNGLYLFSRVPEAKINLRHVGNWMEDMPRLAADYMQTTIDSLPVIQEKIDTAQQRVLQFETLKDMEATIADIIRRSRGIDDILQVLPVKTDKNGILEVSYWDVYQGITNYTTHSTRLSHAARDDIGFNAERALFGPDPVRIIRAPETAPREIAEV